MWSLFPNRRFNFKGTLSFKKTKSSLEGPTGFKHHGLRVVQNFRPTTIFFGLTWNNYFYGIHFMYFFQIHVFKYSSFYWVFVIYSRFQEECVFKFTISYEFQFYIHDFMKIRAIFSWFHSNIIFKFTISWKRCFQI